MSITYYVFYDNALMGLRYIEAPDEYRVTSLYKMTGDVSSARERLERLASKCPKHPAVGYFEMFKQISEPIDNVFESLRSRLSFWNNGVY